jgi:hypothetical protein
MSRQAHMELIILNDYPAGLGDTIYYINNGTKKSSGDVQKITKPTKKQQEEFTAKNGYPMPDVYIEVNCYMIDEKEITNNSKDISGFNIGLSTTIKLPNIPLFLMPEIYYTTIGNKAVYIDSNGNLFNLKAKSNRIDIPVLAGITVIKPLRIFLGPVFSTNLHNSGSSGDFKTIHLNKFLLNYQIGASLHISHLIINVRYENSLSKDKQKFYNREKNILIDYKNRQGLFIMGIGYQF